MSKVTEAVSKLAMPVCERAGCELWDVEYVREAGTYYLRVFIDKEGGIDIDDCENVSRELDTILDAEDPVPDSYVFEVCSPGIERVLRTPEHFAKYIGEKITVKLYTPVGGKKEITGTLIEYNDGLLTINDGEEIKLEKKDYSLVKVYFEF